MSLLAQPVVANYSTSQEYNPGNIKKGVTWKGEVDCVGEFECFQSPRMGIRAMVINLSTYYHLYGLNTIEKIITRWAPEYENQTSDYINYVSGYTMVAPADILTFDPSTIGSLVIGMVIMEQGYLPYPQELIREVVYDTIRTDNNVRFHRHRWSVKNLGHEPTSKSPERTTNVTSIKCQSQAYRRCEEGQGSTHTVDTQSDSIVSNRGHNSLAKVCTSAGRKCSSWLERISSGLLMDRGEGICGMEIHDWPSPNPFRHPLSFCHSGALFRREFSGT